MLSNNQKRGMTEDELLSLSSEKQLTGYSKVSESAECYGMGKALSEYGYYPKNFPLFVGTDHSPCLRDYPSQTELAMEFPVFLSHSQRLVKGWRERSKKPCFNMLSPFVFYRKKNKINLSETALGTLAFPSHSTELINIEHNIQKYIDELRSLPETYQPVSICMYYRDIQKGHYKLFLEQGFPVYTAGHIYDKDFIIRFYNILRRFKFATSHHIGSYTFYSVEMGIPFSLYGDNPAIKNEGDPNLALGYYDIKSEQPQYEIATKIFRGLYTKINDNQKQFVELNLGIGTSISRLQCGALLYYSLLAGCGKKILKKFYHNLTNRSLNK